MSFSNDDYDPDYFVDPPQRSPPPPVQKIVNKKKKRTAIVAKKSKPDPVGAISDVEDTYDGEDGVPHQWTTKQIRTLIQIRLSDEIDRKFRTTKRSHKHLWLAVAKKLQSVGIPVDEIQASSKGGVQVQIAQIPPNTAKYRQIPPNTARYRQIPPNTAYTAKYRLIPPNTA